jgi:hypothetical protein
LFHRQGNAAATAMFLRRKRPRRGAVTIMPPCGVELFAVSLRAIAHEKARREPGFVTERVAPCDLDSFGDFFERRVARLKTVSVCSSQKTRVDNTI